MTKWYQMTLIVTKENRDLIVSTVQDNCHRLGYVEIATPDSLPKVVAEERMATLKKKVTKARVLTPRELTKKTERPSPSEVILAALASGTAKHRNVLRQAMYDVGWKKTSTPSALYKLKRDGFIERVSMNTWRLTKKTGLLTESPK